MKFLTLATLSLTPLLLLSTLPPLASAKGIHCKGSPWCAGAPEAVPMKGITKEHATTLLEYINTLPDDIYIPNNWLIACTRTICAYLTNIIGGGLQASVVKEMAAEIVRHGCERCGRVALGWTPEDKDGGLGERIWYGGYLEFQYVGTKRRTGHQLGDGDGHCGAVLNGLCPDFCKFVDYCVIPQNHREDWTEGPNHYPPTKREVDGEGEDENVVVDDWPYGDEDVDEEEVVVYPGFRTNSTAMELKGPKWGIRMTLKRCLGS